MELSKEYQGHPLAAFFRVLAHLTRPGGKGEPDYTFITAQQAKAAEALRDVFGSDRVFGIPKYRDLHVVVREDASFGEDKWKKAKEILEENQGVVFSTYMREWDKFFRIHEFVFPEKEGTAEQRILWLPDSATERKCSAVFWLAFVLLAYAYYRGGIVFLLFATVPVYAINVHLHEIIWSWRKLTSKAPLQGPAE